MKKKKIGLLFAAMLLVVASVLGTMAYLTSTTETVNNTFTVGKVNIDLDEAKVNEYGQPVDEDGNIVDLDKAPRVTGNEYKLIPGHEYTKDPTVTVLNGSEASYVRMKVTFSHLAELDEIFKDNDPVGADMISIFAGYDENKWEYIGNVKDESKNTRTYEFRYLGTFDALSKDVALGPLFKKINVPGTITNEDLAKIEGMEISVIADAIQADGFADADAAWKAFDEQQ